ncbi:hypothetical protein LY76DRAFT_115417 [Colletotrichum caudatum]|nr:hypothetical protein LY76DRAFT_115417 [Colletotrichum caudatum]
MTFYCTYDEYEVSVPRGLIALRPPSLYVSTVENCSGNTPTFFPSPHTPLLCSASQTDARCTPCAVIRFQPGGRPAAASYPRRRLPCQRTGNIRSRLCRSPTYHTIRLP